MRTLVDNPESEEISGSSQTAAFRSGAGTGDSRPLRIAMVTTFYPPYCFGGDGVYVRRLAHALARRGHEIEVIFDAEAYEFLSGKSGLESLPEPDGVTVHELRSGFGRLSCLATQQFGRPVFNGRAIQRILGDRFDVIHYHNVSLVGGPGILSYGKAVKLYTTHEHWLVCESHILWRHNRELCDGRECFRCALAHRRPPQLWRSTGLLERQCRHVDAFIAPSQSCAENHWRFGFDFPMKVIPSFLPDKQTSLAPESEPAPEERPYFLFVGRLARIKGLQDVIPLFGDDSPADLLIAGTGEHEGELKALAGNRSTVKFLGHCSSAVLGRLYRNAVALIVPSRCYEVAPLVILEAFREGTPIVARDLGPFPEFVKESNGGLLFRTQAELQENLRCLLDEPDLARNLGAAANRAFREIWSEEVAMKRYLSLVDELLESKACRRAA